MASLIVKQWALDTWASVVAVHELSSCGSQAQLLLSLQGLPGAAIKRMSRALAGRFSTTGPPGKTQFPIFKGYTPFIVIIKYCIHSLCFVYVFVGGVVIFLV